MKTVYLSFVEKVKKAESFNLLLIRLVLAYGFYEPAKMKWGNINGIAEWFGSMNYPLPLFNAYMAATIEALAVILLTIGLGTRMIAVPLVIVMFVAIFTVHFSNGFAAGDNGFEIPLYYLLLIFTLIIYGSGKYSVDNFLGKKK